MFVTRHGATCCCGGGVSTCQGDPLPRILGVGLVLDHTGHRWQGLGHHYGGLCPPCPGQAHLCLFLCHLFLFCFLQSHCQGLPIPPALPWGHVEKLSFMTGHKAVCLHSACSATSQNPLSIAVAEYDNLGLEANLQCMPLRHVHCRSGAGIKKHTNHDHSADYSTKPKLQNQDRKQGW